MKKLVLFFFTFNFSLFTSLQAQNLVPNPSFEEYNTCPDNQNQIHFATGWSNYWNTSHNSTPDYFNSCSTTSWMSVPHNLGGYQKAANGNAYAGVYTYETPQYPSDTIVREFIGVQLLSPLVIGNKYYFSFKTNLALDANHTFNQATNNIGMLFSTIPHNFANPTPLTNFAHLHSPSVITDTMNWTTISGSYIADSAYKYVIIGNFFDDAHTIVLQMQDTLSDKSAYYYIDDVYVSKDSIAGGIAKQDVEGRIIVYPNPFHNSAIVSITGEKNLMSISLYDSLGKRQNFDVLPTFTNDGIKIQIRRNALSAGIYFLKIQFDNNENCNYKLIIQ